ncbi:MAG: copper chaperone PCu(A)C [Ilumatobacteraceae bacterium]
MTTPRWNALALAAGLTLVPVLAACGDDDDSTGDTVAVVEGAPLSIADPWSREPAAGQMMTAAYGVIANTTDRELQIVGGTSPSADRVETHETMMDDEGTMSMQQLEGGFNIPPQGELVLEPGGPHLMLIGIDPDDYEGPIEITLLTDIQDTFTFEAEVRSIDGG